MHFHLSTVITLVLVLIGICAATPVLYRGFSRRGKGKIYEHNYIIQRAPQMASLLTVLIIIPAHLCRDGVLNWDIAPLLTQAALLPEAAQDAISWLGVAIFVSGLIFMIGGWYSLGESFSTDAEVLHNQTIRKDGLLGVVMHPAYSGIIQSLLGTSIACLSLPAVLLTVCLVAPLWLNRAKYEEQLLIKTFGEQYKQYAEELKWRRLVPVFIPLGV
ncbi:MAG: isoprenylcysteine carboxylmethyltransferase family protein [Candidatus Obscuribacterales bacterium]|nr:isoprenylcysteine carboxylmethyltransferase family protein [Candidatus Obscuribacterales bacterium]